MQKTKKLKRVLINNFILIVLLPVLVMGFLFLTWSTHDLHFEIMQKNNLNIHMIISEINNELAAILEDSKAHINILENVYKDENQTASILVSLIKSHRNILLIQMITNSGKNTFFDPLNMKHIMLEFPWPVFRKEQFRQNSYLWHDCIFVPALGIYILPLAIPFSGGIIIHYLDLSATIRDVRKLTIGKEDILLILDRKGNNLIQNSPEDQATLNKITDAIDRQQDKRVTINRIPYLIYSDVVRDTGWKIVILLSLNEIYLTAGKYILFMAGFILMVFIVSLIYSIKQWNPIINAIQNLITSIQKVSEGNYNLTLKQSPFSEIRELGDYFLNMVQAIKQRENELVESREKILKIFDSSPYGLTVTDLEGIIIDCNPASAVLHGYASREEMIGINAFQLIAFEDLEKAKNNLVRTMNEGALNNAEYTLLKKNGEKFHGTLSSRILMNADNNPIAFIAITTDISEQKKIETGRENIIASLEQKQAELERFIYAVSHDLRSPLITIKGFLGFLEEDIDQNNADQLKQDIKKISNAVDKMNNLLNDLLELSRIGRILNEKEPVSLNTILNDVSEILTCQLNEKNINLEIQPDLPVISGNYERLTELFQNLVENSIKYMGDQEKPTITIGCRKNKFETVFFVRDNGIGIDPRYHEKIFGLFDQLNRNSPGTGIGLAIVKRIVETHEGKIWVESEGKGKGTTFFFTLGAAEQEQETAEKDMQS